MNIYPRLIKYLRPYRGRLLVALMIMIISSLADVLVSGVIYVTTNGLMNRDYVTLQGIPHLPSRFAITFDVIWVPVIIIIVFIARGLFAYLSKYIIADVGLCSVRDIQNDLYTHVTSLSCDYFTKKHSGDIMSRITGDVRGVQNSITTVILDVIKSPLEVIMMIPIIIIMGGWVAIISIAVFPLVAIPIILLGRKLRKLTQRLLERSADIVSFLSETITGIKIVKAFNAEAHESKKFRAMSESIYQFARKSVRAIELQRPVIEIMGSFGVAISIYFALKHLPIDRFMTFAGSLYLLYEPAKKLSKVNVVIQQALASGKRIFEVLDAKSTVVEKADAQHFKDDVRDITFRNVTFAYESDHTVLRNISFSVTHGQCVAIVGASGSGKSTLLSLIPRFYDPQHGSILINGIIIADMRLYDLRALVGIVSQETILFNGTVYENIAYGNLKATGEDIRKAAHLAYAHAFIESMPNGYETRIGERGLNLSGGQRQRLSIARAILKNPAVLIFDEATSHLDTESEREVQKGLDNLMSGRTVFVIAHRLSTVQHADRILVMDRGVIVQDGTHVSLIAQNGPYKRLYELQFAV